MKQKIIITVIVIVIGLAIYFYYKGKNSEPKEFKKLASTGNPALEAEDNAFTKELWAAFTKSTGESPNWVMESAIATVTGESDHHLGLGSFYRHKGVLLKSGALFATIQAGYQPLGKLSQQQWQELWDMYSNWHNKINLKY